MVREGGCLCGAVRFKAEGKPLNVRACHCRKCQKAYGAPFNARAQFYQKDIQVEGPTAGYISSPTGERVFCSRCGTRFMSRWLDGSLAGLALVTFDDRNAFAPESHIWVSEKVAWLKLDDGLPQYPERFPT